MAILRSTSQQGDAAMPKTIEGKDTRTTGFERQYEYTATHGVNAEGIFEWSAIVRSDGDIERRPCGAVEGTLFAPDEHRPVAGAWPNASIEKLVNVIE